MLIDKFPSFLYFKKYVQCDLNTQILDFGSNWGNYISSNPGVFDNKNYTGIDIDQEAIDEGKGLFPEATWIWYNRYNPVYNPTGEQVLPELNQKFDLIISYSVFTHMSLEDMLEILDYLFEQLNPGGTICFSYCNIDNPTCVNWFRDRRENCDPIDSRDYSYLVNNQVSLNAPTDPVRHFVAFYKTEFLLEKLSKFNPRSEPPHSTVWGGNLPNINWFQDAIIITK
jgi:2-polyprenyl-3-methyl-5-hydroxy-6-metoxy-1,4-benzoquinol methylase